MALKVSLIKAAAVFIVPMVLVSVYEVYHVYSCENKKAKSWTERFYHYIWPQGKAVSHSTFIRHLFSFSHTQEAMMLLWKGMLNVLGHLSSSSCKGYLPVIPVALLILMSAGVIAYSIQSKDMKRKKLFADPDIEITGYDPPECLTARSRNRVSVRKGFLYLALLLFGLSLPWEFIRLYQTEVAKQASHLAKGIPGVCERNPSMWEMIKHWWSVMFSWSGDPCQQYSAALLVDPLWSVTPLMVLSSALTRCVCCPLEVISSSTGRSLQQLFQHIPAPWQPVLMAVLGIVLMMIVLMTCRYRLSMPLLVCIEPNSNTPPVTTTNYPKVKEKSKISVGEH